MRLYLKTIFAALLPVLLAALIGILHINKLEMEEKKNQLSKLEIEARGIKERITEEINTLKNSAQILADATDVANAVLYNDNDVLYNWGALFLGKGVDRVSFISLDGYVVARSHDEFRFGDSFLGREEFSKAPLQDGFLGITKEDGIELLTYATLIKKYKQIDSGVVVASKIMDDGFFSKLTAGNDLKVTPLGTQDDTDIITHGVFFAQSLEVGDVNLLIYQQNNKELDNFMELKRDILYAIATISLILIVTIVLVIYRHLLPYQKLIAVLKKYEGKVDDLKILEEDSKELFSKHRGHEIGKIAKALELFSSKAKENQLRIESINKELDNKIREEVLKNEQKEKLLIFRDRQAQMGVMMDSIMHQWKQPLTIIGLKTDILISMLESDYDIDATPLIKELEDITKQIRFISKTNANLSNFFKRGTPQEIFSPMESIETVVALFGKLFKTNGISIPIDGDRHILIKGNSNEFMQVVLNIIDNAKDQIVSKNIKNGTINCIIRQNNDYAYVIIKDNGGGVREDIMDKVFEYRLSTKGDKGSGIGLFLSKKIITEGFGGEIHCDNADDGAMFTIKIKKL